MSHTIDKSARRQQKLGRQLAAEKKACRASGRTWKSYVTEHLGLSRERADELIRIGEGSLSVDDSRARKRKHQRKSRLRRTMPSAAMIAELVHRSKSTRDKVLLGLSVRRFSVQEIAEIEAASREAIAIWEGLLQVLER